jgi:hypothetical protein
MPEERESKKRLLTERQLFDRLFVEHPTGRPAELVRELMVLGLFNFYKWDDAISREESGHPADSDYQMTKKRVDDLEHAVAATLELRRKSSSLPRFLV